MYKNKAHELVGQTFWPHNLKAFERNLDNDHYKVSCFSCPLSILHFSKQQFFNLNCNERVEYSKCQRQKKKEHS